MSQALKCDRCKTCFDPYEQTELCTSIPEMLLFDGKAMLEHRYIKRHHNLDFCPTCTRELMKFLNFSIAVKTSSLIEA